MLDNGVTLAKGPFRNMVGRIAGVALSLLLWSTEGALAVAEGLLRKIVVLNVLSLSTEGALAVAEGALRKIVVANVIGAAVVEGAKEAGSD